MPVELKITGENTTELLIHLSELGDIAHAVLNSPDTEGRLPPTPYDALKNLHEELEQELKDVLADNGEVPPPPTKPKGKGGRPRKVATPAPEPEEAPAEKQMTNGSELDAYFAAEKEKEETIPAPVPEDLTADLGTAGPTAPEAEADEDELKQKLFSAIAILSHAYQDEKGKPLVLAVRKKYGVSKFGEIPFEKGTELLADAEGVKKGMTA